MGSHVVRKLHLGLSLALVTTLALATAASVYAAPAVSFRAYGQGGEPSITPSCTALCPSGDSCACTPVSGHGTASVIGPVAFTATVATDISHGAGQCAELFGTALLTSTTTPKNKIALDFTGSLCASPTGTANIMNAVYFINPTNSKGAFKNATGSGNVTGSRDSNVKILGSVIGTLRFP